MRLRGTLPTLCTALLASLIGASSAAAAPGDLDSSFGSGGITGAGVQLLGVAVESDGSVVAAGQAGGRAVVDHFSAAGQLEGAWAGPGGYARGIAVEPNGDVVVSGQGNGGLFVARLTSSLAPDGSFGSGGVATAFPGGAGYGVAVEPDGSVVAAGGVGSGIEVARFSATGGVEWADSGIGGSAFARGVAVQPDGKIVVVGQQRALQVTNGVIARLNPDGSLDSGFASGGATIYFYPNTGYTSLSAVAVQNDGRIDVAGVSAGGPIAFFLRYNSNGSLDQSFGSGGASGLPAGQNITVPDADARPVWRRDRRWRENHLRGGVRQHRHRRRCGRLGCHSDGGDGDRFRRLGHRARPIGDVGGVCRGGRAGRQHRYGRRRRQRVSRQHAVHGGLDVERIRLAPHRIRTAAAARLFGCGALGDYGQRHRGQATSATVTGAVNPNGLQTAYYFAYGKTTSYGSNTAAGTLAAGSTSDTVSAALSKLAPSTTYHFALVAANADGTTVGPDVTFKTSASPPKLTVVLHGVPSSYKIRSLTAHGLTIKLTCGSACSVRASLLVSSKLAKRLGLGHQQTAIASGSASLRSAGTVKVTLHVSKSAKHAVSRSSSLAVTLRIVATPTGGGSAQTINKGLTLKH